MIKARAFKPEDYALFFQWHKSFGLKPCEKRFLPALGCVIEDEEWVLAIGFCYLTDSPIALLDGFVRNPDISKDRANEALDLLVSSLLSEAKREGAELMMAFSNLPVIIERAQKLGFNKIRETTSLAKGL